ncbi:type I secretion system permease/ATPase [Roseobacter denitrificans]|uniref:Toxin secretion ABC transporter, ATP-binding component, putative n=1 Tax=Roseobacter denitrificans (strain ATCC 33942 / OCh 114) TaxID=375451 RepID=Q16B63_ROSDO|nr:type I secretion system permease/ATPase [Roseobacter denitrificans]ABG30780.1 toxin secretion ABC transporter, ATP-binding component, putative [Roseobacter denitrificans OCh 114]AVL53888.1 type I secretion system permease/ATPase [Roseobacter denitrificans]SFG46813.1 ATP-binding cassette, subfamily C, LapB [Roseobacter denitrificans OCh 114]
MTAERRVPISKPDKPAKSRVARITTGSGTEAKTQEIVAKVTRSNPDWALDAGPTDPLAASLVEAMRISGTDIAVEVLTGGLGLPSDGRLSPELAVSAAERHGMRARLERRRLGDIDPAEFPVVLLLRGRDACVLTARNEDETYSVLRPSQASDTLKITQKALLDLYVGHVILLQRQAETLGDTKLPTASGHWLWGALRPFWPEYMQVVLASVLINFLALAVPLFTMNVYDRVFPNAAIITLWSLVAGVALALGFDALLKLLRSGVIDRVGRKVDASVSASVFRHVSNLRLDEDVPPSGSLMNTLKDYEQVADFFSSQTLSHLIDLAFAVLFIALIYYIGGPLAYPPALALGFVLLMGLIILRPLRGASEHNRATGGAKTLVASEAVSELETLKAVAGHNRMQSRWERQSADAAMTQAKSRRLATLATTLTALATQASSIGIVVIGVYLALEGQITMGAVIAAMILSGRALAPTAAVTGLFVRGSFAISTLQSLGKLMNQRSDADGRGRTINTTDRSGEIELKDVSLNYQGAVVPALKNVSLKVSAGSHIGIIGPIGAGKTSLTRVMAGLWPPTDGLILLDGLNTRQIAPETLRRFVQLVPQEAVLFTGTLAENIAFGVPGARDEDILRAARDAGVDRIAASHPDGFGMQITERGRNLSGGQRQMIALARALLPQPRVLILDEPTSAMDMQSEMLFIDGVERALARKPMTLVVSTHRMALMRLVTHVAVMTSGTLRSYGPRDEVLSSLKDAGKGTPS